MLVITGQLMCFGFLEAHDYSVSRSRGYAALLCNLLLYTVALGLSFPTQCEFLNLFDLCGTVAVCGRPLHEHRSALPVTSIFLISFCDPQRFRCRLGNILALYFIYFLANTMKTLSENAVSSQHINDVIIA